MRWPALLPLLLVAGIALAGPAERALPGVVNPHGNPDACLSCHNADDKGGVGIAKPPTAACRSCHPTADPHPVGIKPVDVKVPEGWPLEDSKLGCWTCHVETAHGGKDATVPPPWFRGGPYAKKSDLCYACHERTGFARTDPHHPDALRSRADGSCQACHATIPEDGAAPEASKLLVPANEVCGTCHEGSLHLGVENHVGHKVEPEVAAKLPKGITLDEEGRVRCWSCHEVHDPTPEVGKKWAGDRPLAAELNEMLMEHGWSERLPEGVTWPGGGEGSPMLAQPLVDGSLCHACHGDGPS